MSICDFFRKKPKTVHCPEKKGFYNQHPVALVIGHNQKAQGAVNYLGESEYSFNHRVAHELHALLIQNGIDTIIIERPNGSYKSQCEHVKKEIQKHKARLCFELHFNAVEARAKGAEVLICHVGDPAIDSMATRFLSHLCDSRKLTNRGVKALDYGEPGHWMLLQATFADAIPMIIEPCFGHWEHDESKTIFEQEPLYVTALMDAIYRLVRS